ncbi:DNA cytosine methyltransferase [Halomicroarcula sp. S1AR25-4]|uniref:DNA cytosine methyltransferase n=1 Tax=Haloarcula sp. S1AR25-4 TaxID=2950538 RepID=UPI0028765E5D|nr:DNA cytosine methyltransferase [Halomicroarcula sp. S1AR25-4]MDS0278039.1 DNA cytosine methyltransferase [Halomicroarcula sp. S1AR25-4]
MEFETPPTVLDVFCGAGGFSTGFEQAGFDVLAGIDADNDALATFYANHDSDAYNLNVGELSPAEVCDAVGISPGDVDAVIGGPPCQGHSGLGESDPDDPRNTLMWDYLDLVDYLNPRAVIIENVPDIKATADGAFLTNVLERVDNIGYDIAYNVLTASDFEVPQMRSRLFVVGLRDGVPRLPDLPPLSPPPVYEVLNRVQLRDELPNNDWRAQLGRHGDGLPDDFYPTPLGKDPYANSDHQVRAPLRGPIRTIIAENLHFHTHQPRYLTVREAAALQSFPDDYRFFGGVGAQREQVGNAVPPLLAQHIARTVRESLELATLRGQTTLSDHGVSPADD